jgi:hypothetical protein
MIYVWQTNEELPKSGWVLYQLRNFSGFRHGGNEISALLGFYAAWDGKSYRPFGRSVGPIFKGKEILTLENGTDRLSEKVGKNCHSAPRKIANSADLMLHGNFHIDL